MNKLKDFQKNLIDRYYGEADNQTKKTGFAMGIGTAATQRSGDKVKGKIQATATTATEEAKENDTITQAEIKASAEAEAKAKVEPEVDSEAADFEFEKELTESMELLNVFCDDDIKIPNDFFSIIEKAEEIKTKKESNREFVMFILASLVILLSIAAITFQVGVKIFIIMQVALYFILPISLIPISIAAVKRGEAR